MTYPLMGFVRERWRGASVRNKALLVIVLSTAPSLMALAGIYWVVSEQHKAEAWTANSTGRIDGMHEILRLLVDQETATRGYLLTGREDFLEPYHRGRARLSELITTVSQSLSGEQSHRFKRVERLIADKVRIMALQIDMLRGGTPIPGDSYLVAGKQMMDALRLEVADLVREEEANLQNLSRQIAYLQQVSFIAILAALASSTIAAVLAARILLRRVVNRVLALHRAAKLIGNDEQVRFDVEAPDEIGLLAQELEKMSSTLLERGRAAESARKVAEAANAAKSEFLSRVSHELRTPMNSILGFSQLLEQENLTEDQHDNLRHIIVAGRQLLIVINELLDISSIELGNLDFNIERIETAEVVREALSCVRPLADEAGITITCDDPQAPMEVAADRHRVWQILVNLLSNAIKFNRPNGNVHVALRFAPGRVCIEVSDSGEGIPADRLPNLFTPFQRFGAELRGIEGTGLGLATSMALAKGMRGELTASSTVGVGSTFSLVLPAMSR